MIYLNKCVLLSNEITEFDKNLTVFTSITGEYIDSIFDKITNQICTLNNYILDSKKEYLTYEAYGYDMGDIKNILISQDILNSMNDILSIIDFRMDIDGNISDTVGNKYFFNNLL
jgi:hypothetical protein